MTAAQLIVHLQELIEHGMPEAVEVIIYDAECEECIPVTGFLYDDKTLELQTDDTEQRDEE